MAPPDPVLSRRGERLLENWGRWAREHDAALGYPKGAPWARLYRPDAGDVWEGPAEGAEAARVSEDDAVTTEAFVLHLGHLHRLCVRSVFLKQDAPIVTCAKLGMGRPVLDELLYVLQEDCARWAMR